MLDDVHRVVAHIRNDVALPLVRRLARRSDVHLEMLDRSVIGQADRGVTTTHTRKAIDFIAHDLVAAAHVALDGNGVVAEEREIAILLCGRARLARGDREKDEHGESVHPLSPRRGMRSAASKL